MENSKRSQKKGFTNHYIVLRILSKTHFLKTLLNNLTFWVLVAIIAGICIGHFTPNIGIQMQILGTGFVEIIKFFILPIVFLTISMGISGMNNLKQVGKVGAKALLYFEIVTTLALLIGLAIAYAFEPGEGVSIQTTTASEISQYQNGERRFSWIMFFKTNHTIQVLILSIFFGIWLSNYSKKETVMQFLTNVSKVVFKALHGVMLLAPVGALGGMAFTIGKYGIATLVPLAKLMVSVYATMALFVFGVWCFVFDIEAIQSEYFQIPVLYPCRIAFSVRHFFFRSRFAFFDGKIGKDGLPQIGRRFSCSSRLFFQFGWNYHLPVDGCRILSTSLWSTIES